MSAPRLVLLALAALLATGGAFWLSSQRHLERAVLVGDPVLPQLRAALGEVAELRLSRGDGTQVTLQRAAEGWQVVERHWPVDAGKLRKLLLDLAALEIVEEKTHDPARYPVLGVEDVAGPSAGGVRLDLKTSKGAIHSLVVGKPSGARAGYVRAVGASPSYLARPQLMVDAQPARWLDTSLLDIAATRVAAVTLRGGNGPARTLQGAQLPSELAGALTALALQDLRPRPLEPSGGSGPPTRRARFLLRDGITIDVEGVEDGPRRWIRLAASFEAANATAKPGDLAAEAKRLATRLDGREFEIPSYRYSTLFALDPAAAPSPAALPGLQGRFD